MRSTCAGSSGARMGGTATVHRAATSPNSAVANQTAAGGRGSRGTRTPATTRSTVAVTCGRRSVASSLTTVLTLTPRPR
jgi:hypothetical protein